MSLIPVKYEVKFHTFINHRVYVESREQGKWVVTTGDSSCLNTDGHFEYEPSPSNRVEEFLARTRHSSPEDALAAFAKHMPNFPAYW